MLYDCKICETLCLNCLLESVCPAFKSSLSLFARSNRKRAHTVSIEFRSPLLGEIALVYFHQSIENNNLYFQ